MNQPWLSAAYAVVLLVCATGQGDSADAAGREDMIPVRIVVGDAVFAAKFRDTASTRVLLEHIPLTVEMRDYAGQEKVARLPYAFPPAATERPATVKAGEIYLWSTDSLVLFYTTFSNSYGGYVRLGHIEDATGLREALGAGTAVATFLFQSHESNQSLLPNEVDNYKNPPILLSHVRLWQSLSGSFGREERRSYNEIFPGQREVGRD